MIYIAQLVSIGSTLHFTFGYTELHSGRKKFIDNMDSITKWQIHWLISDTAWVNIVVTMCEKGFISNILSILT